MYVYPVHHSHDKDQLYDDKAAEGDLFDSGGRTNHLFSDPYIAETALRPGA